MALKTKTSPVGLDIIIDGLQNHLFNGLTASPGPAWTIYESYPRAYKNETDNGLIPEFYVGNNKYDEVFFDDGFNVTSFWLVGDTTELAEGANYTTDVKIIFQAKLDELYPLIAHRADEEMHRDITLLLENNPYTDGFVIKKTTGIRKIYSDEGLTKTNGFEDMSNYHVVKFDLKINYRYNC